MLWTQTVCVCTCCVQKTGWGRLYQKWCFQTPFTQKTEVEEEMDSTTTAAAATSSACSPIGLDAIYKRPASLVCSPAFIAVYSICRPDRPNSISKLRLQPSHNCLREASLETHVPVCTIQASNKFQPSSVQAQSKIT